MVDVDFGQFALYQIEQAGVAGKKYLAGPDGDGKAPWNRKSEHIGQFSQIGVLGTHAVGHGRVHFGEGQGELGHISGGVLNQLVLNVRRNIPQHFPECFVVPSSGQADQGFGHGSGAGHGPARLMAHLIDIHMFFAP